MEEVQQSITEHFTNARNVEGLLLYFFGAFTSLFVKIHYRKEWMDGLKGDNKSWESPEIMLAILFLFFDHIFMADAFLGMVMSWNAWVGFGILFLYGFTGRWGLQWLSAWKGTKQVQEDSENLKN